MADLQKPKDFDFTIFMAQFPQPPTFSESEEVITTDDAEALQSLLDNYDPLFLEKSEYRRNRAAEYIERLSPEGTFATSVGDIFDALLAAFYRMKQTLTNRGITFDSSELDQIMGIIQEIKDRNPKSDG